MKIYLIFLVVFGLGSPFFCQASIIINEIAWMGTTTSANNEWIELKSMANQPTDLTGWKLTSADGKLNIPLKGAIQAQGFYLLERTDENSVPLVKADLIYKGALSNEGEHLILKDKAGNAIDELDFMKWPAGNNEKKQTMERTLTGWQTSLNPNGTPKQENGPAAPPLAPKPTKKTSSTPKTTLPKVAKPDNNKLKTQAQASIAENSLSIGEQFSANHPLILFLLVLVIIAITGITIIIYKYYVRSQSL
jgi:hypothetical protein